MNLFLTEGFAKTSLVTALRLATAIMHNYALCIPKEMWEEDPKHYTGGPFGPVQHLLHVTTAEIFFRNWLSDRTLGTNFFRLPGAMREAMEMDFVDKQQRLASINQQFVILAKKGFSSLDDLIDKFNVTRHETVTLLNRIHDSQLQQKAAHPITNQGGTLGTVCYMIFATHVQEHAFTLKSKLIIQRGIRPPSIYYDDAST